MARPIQPKGWRSLCCCAAAILEDLQQTSRPAALQILSYAVKMVLPKSHGRAEVADALHRSRGRKPFRG